MITTFGSVCSGIKAASVLLGIWLSAAPHP
jgi:hypothetical protein